MTTSVSQAELSARLDELLVEFFAIFADIRSVRSQLSSSVSDGFYSLALARHESPLLPLDQSSYVGRDMTATTTITHTAGKGKAASASKAADNQPIIFCLNQQRIAAPSSSALTSDSSSASSPIRPGVFTAHQSARERKLDALIAQRGQLDDAIEQQIDQSVAAADMAASAPPSIPLLPSQPLLWFGLLAPQPLTEAQRAFQQSMERVARLCALHDRLRLVEEQWMSALEQKDRAMAEERRRAADRWAEDSEKSEVAEEEENGSSVSALRKEREESKEEARSKSTNATRVPATQQRSSVVDESSKEQSVADAMQSLSIGKHRKKDS